MPLQNYMIAHKENKYFHPQKHIAHSIKKIAGLLILMQCINKLYLCVPDPASFTGVPVAKASVSVQDQQFLVSTSKFVHTYLLISILIISNFSLDWQYFLQSSEHCPLHIKKNFNIFFVLVPFRWWPSYLCKCCLPVCLSPVPSKTLTHLPPGQNGCHFTDNIFRYILVNEKFCILVEISLIFVPKFPIDNIPALV